MADIFPTRREVTILTLLVPAFLGTFLLPGIARSPLWHQIKDTKPRADSVSAKNEKNHFEIRVTHSFGIGKADFCLDKGHWSPGLRLKFCNFKRLEGFKIWTESKKFEGSVPEVFKNSAVDFGPGLSATRRNNAICITAANFLDPKDRTIHIEWIDYYRN